MHTLHRSEVGLRSRPPIVVVDSEETTIGVDTDMNENLTQIRWIADDFLDTDTDASATLRTSFLRDT